MRAGRLWGSGRAATGARQPHQLQVSLDFKAGPANDVHVCRPRGVVVAQREPEDPLLGAIVERPRGGASGCRVEPGEGSLDIIK